MNLFAYGTLIDQRLFGRIIGRTLQYSVPAVLPGYKKWETTLGYPIVLPDTMAKCTGVVYFSLTQSDWKRLDEYEHVDRQPPSYYRRLVKVEGTHGSITAHVYVGNLNFFRMRIKA